MSEVLIPRVRLSRGPLFGVLAVGFALRLMALGWTGDLGPRILDEQHYLVLATSIVEGRGFATATGPTSLRPPLYPAFIAGVWTLAGSRSLQAVRVAQFVVGLLTALIVFALTRDLFGGRAAAWAAGITWLYPSLVVSNYLMLSEVLFSLFVATAAWACVRLFTTASAASAAAGGAAIALAALTRSVLYPFPIVVAIMVVIWAPAPLVRRLLLAAIVVAAWASVLAPWAVRNTRLQRVPVLVDTMGGMNLRMGNYEYTPLDRMWDAVSMQDEKSWIVGLPPSPPDAGHWTEGQKERWARDRALQFMVQHPGLTLGRAAVKFGDFWGLERDFVAGVQEGIFRPSRTVAIFLAAAITLSYPAVMFLALAGIGQLTRSDWPAGFMPLAILLFVCALHSIVFGHPRYRLPLMPLLCSYAGVALAQGAWRLSSERRAARWPLLAAGALLALWTVQFAWRDWPHAEQLLAGWFA
jgi:4-amino-4-deoxy-L-arabinose transferase-like glycosyltransferase